ncbi:thioredoxin [Paracholeplasma manati]|jgi:thioredoxin 1|uniref:Thioredoxin n=1 Tax=Paracholeplasma manati TaxID=591373 RepID=A0ABT2Y4I1_9MOLU|nr:thioredoxin [Paracholeplasma manati]MCV2231639.1 thioredoxin [Paracholeplasma manati]MDG0888618.1 thioredoxin [Paracholeplasma manati]MDX9807321.1 thioredoxin [Acholeplasma sp.]
MAIAITKENFKSVVLESSEPVLVDFWAAWCRPCQMLGPIVESLSEEVKGLAVVGKVNVDEQAELANQFRIMSIPTVLVFKGGKVVNSIIGVRSKDELRKALGV